MMVIKLHRGRGEIYVHSLIRIDARKFPHIDMVGSADKLPFEDSLIDVIYACHLLKYFKRHEIESVYRAWRRVVNQMGFTTKRDFQSWFQDSKYLIRNSSVISMIKQYIGHVVRGEHIQ